MQLTRSATKKYISYNLLFTNGRYLLSMLIRKASRWGTAVYPTFWKKKLYMLARHSHW
jgi:hypothetical protein